MDLDTLKKLVDLGDGIIKLAVGIGAAVTTVALWIRRRRRRKWGAV